MASVNNKDSRKVALFRHRSVAIIVTLLFLVTFFKGMAWTVIVPIGQQPDEPAHASYVDSMANRPSVQQSARVYNQGLDDSLIASAIGVVRHDPQNALPFSDSAIKKHDELIDTSKTSRKEINVGNAPSFARSYPPLYYYIDSIAVRASSGESYDSTFFLMRSVSVLIASVTIVVQFFVLLAIFSSIAMAGVAGLVLTLMPMYTSMESAVNPDVLVTLFGSIIILVSIKLLSSPYRIRHHVAVGLVLALALLTKPSAIAFFPPYIFASILGVVRTRVSIAWRKIALAAASFATPILLLYFPWRFVPVKQGSVEPTGEWPNLEVTTSTVTHFIDRIVSQGKWRFSDMYWGIFGWIDAPMPQWVFAVGFLVSAVVVTVLLLELIKNKIPVKIILCITFIAMILGMVLFIEYISVIGESKGYLNMEKGFIQGRYFFPVAVAIVAVQMWALDTIVKPRWRLRSALWIVTPTIVLAFQLIAIFNVVIPRYFL